jgi:thiosulfate dehydrogenase [quinone] large subunit
MNPSEVRVTPDDANRLDGLMGYGLTIGRVIVGYLWYTQLLWKMPPRFGCPADFAVSTSLTARTSGLCDWTGLMALYSKIPLHASLVRNIIAPHLSWIGWLIWLTEAFVAVSLVFGLFSRLGALVGFLQAVNLYIGLTAIPGEWYWAYGMLYTLHLIFLFAPPGRKLGIDALLRSRLPGAAARGNRLARIILWLT